MFARRRRGASDRAALADRARSCRCSTSAASGWGSAHLAGAMGSSTDTAMPAASEGEIAERDTPAGRIPGERSVTSARCRLPARHTQLVDLEQTDLILLLLSAPTSDEAQRFRCNGITRLEKLLFLVEEETDFADHVAVELFTFKPYHYGPYSREVYDAVDLLQALRLLEQRQVDVATGLDLGEESEALDEFDINRDDRYVERQLVLTQDGRDVTRVLTTRISPQGMRALEETKDRYGTMPLRQLLRYIYSEYPEYAEASRIRASL